jgi:hypothetical protein
LLLENGAIKATPTRARVNWEYKIDTNLKETGREINSLALENSVINPLTPNDLQRRRAVSPLKIKIPSKNTREKPTNTPIIHSAYFGITLPSSGSVPYAF